MAKIKVKNISNSQMNKICKENKCETCPLRRLEKGKDGKIRQIMCYRRIRAWYYANKIYYEELFKQPLTERQREYHEWQWQNEQEEQLKLEETEIDKTWN